jgi:hypothetical protein
MKYNKEKLFIISSLLFLISLTIFYSFRLVYYYKIENSPLPPNQNLIGVLTSQSNIVTSGDGLYETEDEYIFRGTNVNNYLYYSSRIWRIIGINDDGSIKIITDEPQTTIVWGYDSNDYNNSYIRSWLNPIDDVENTGFFYNSLDDADIYITTSNWCADIIEDVNNVSCNNIVDNDAIGLLSINDYKKAGAQNSYLKKEFYEWTINGYTDNQVWYRMPSGELSNNSNSENSYYAHAVRPVVNIKGDIKVISGDGKKESPFIIRKNNVDSLEQVSVGDYIDYSGYNWRVSTKNDEAVKLVMNGYIKDQNGDLILKSFSTKGDSFNPSKIDNIGYYLNNNFYNSLSNYDYLVMGNWNSGDYNSENNYDYKKVYDSKIEAKVGLLSVGELFVNDFDSYATITGANKNEETIYTILADGRLFADSVETEMKVRPSIFIDITLNIVSGNGTIKNPYKISR